MQNRKLIVFSMFMLLKSQTSAIKFVFSFIPYQSNSDVGNLTCKSDVVYNTLLLFLPLINSKWLAHLFIILSITRPVYIESRVCVVKEAVMCSFEY